MRLACKKGNHSKCTATKPQNRCTLFSAFQFVLICMCMQAQKELSVIKLLFPNLFGNLQFIHFFHKEEALSHILFSCCFIWYP